MRPHQEQNICAVNTDASTPKNHIISKKLSFVHGTKFAKTKKRMETLLPKIPLKKEVKNSFMKRLKTKRVNIDELKTNIKNAIVKQFIPAKEKKNLINQLLSME